MDKNRYMVRQAIKDMDSHVLGYEIMYSAGHEAYGDGSENEVSAAQAIYDFLMHNSEKALKDSRTFMTFTSSLLAKRTPHLFKNTDLVIQIDDSVIIHPFAMHLVQQYVKEGYEIAADEFQFMPRYLALLEYLSYIKINLKSIGASSAENIMRVAQSMNKKVIATGVDTKELCDLAKKLNVYGMQGEYVADKLANEVHQSTYLRSNFFRLVVAVTREEPDIQEIEQIISMDVTLSYSLLKLSNSAYFARRTKTTSIQQAIMTLGLNQLKRWVYLLSAGDEAEDDLTDSEEFIKISFMRASFASELQRYIRNPVLTRSEAYLLGMFSTLEYLIDAPMEEILADIPMVDELRDALLYHTGSGGKLLDLVISYEKANWKNITDNAEALGIPSNQLTTIYFNCMEEVNRIWNQMLNSTVEKPEIEEPMPE
ncbi:MAG TPA: HDOD domain-containing protein [Candidatus Agathobaculum merdigallinarum]|nr:HDOD domain-containing protein [Candidatus Agathobaculum merdigallinarum]